MKPLLRIKYAVYLLFFCVAVSVIGCKEKKTVPPFQLQNGDLLFQANVSDPFNQAVQKAETGYGQLEFSHVGIVNIEHGDTMVIEAVFSGVQRRSLSDFLAHSAHIDGKPYVLVGRLREPYAPLASEAVKRAETLIGKTYDVAFLPDNDQYYCSELVYYCYRDTQGKPLFTAKPMSFKDAATGEFFPAWVQFFDSLQLAIPEGVPGTNPNGLSNDPVIEIIYNYMD